MIIYNVTYSIDPEVHEDWLAWMKGNYIPEVISYGNLSQVNLNQVISEEDSFITYAAQYVFSSMKDFSYFQCHPISITFSNGSEQLILLRFPQGPLQSQQGPLSAYIASYS